MRKLFLLGAVALACAMQAKTVTLDVANPLSPATVEYDANGVWTETYNEEDYVTIDYQSMSFTHLYGEESWSGAYWDGFTISKSTGKTYAAMEDQFNCVAGGGLAGEGTPFLVGYFSMMGGLYNPCQVFFDDAYTPQEVYICQSAWAYENILNGGSPARAFEQGDSCVLIIRGLDDTYDVIDDKSVVVWLADYRSANSAEWTVNAGWEKCDLTALGDVYGLDFEFVSSDNSSLGANTASYFALDGLKIRATEVATFENEAGGINLTTDESNWFGADAPANGWNVWTSGDFTFKTYYTDSYKSAFVVTNETSTDFTGYNDAYRSAAGGAYEDDNFAVWNLCYYGLDTITFEKQVVKGFFVNNNSYTVSSMCNGDGFAKKFGADDWFKLTCIGVLEGAEVARVNVDLAKDGKYIDEWTYVDLSTLGEIDGVTFEMSSSDTGEWGMNTPAYFAMDNFGDAEPDGYVAPEMAEFEINHTAIRNTVDGVNTVKQVRNGQLIIIRDNKVFNVLGAEIK